MDFTAEYTLPLEMGQPPAYYRDRLTDLSEHGRSLVGTLEVEGTPRDVSCGINDDRATTIAVSTFLPGDTFQQVPLANTPIKIQKDLHRRGIESILRFEVLGIPDYLVSLHFFEDEVCVIRWYDPKHTSREDFVATLG